MMLQGVPGLIGNSGDGGATTNTTTTTTTTTSATAAAQAQAQAHHESGGGGGGEVGVASTVSGGFSEEERGRIEEGERSSGGGNRWPRQETLALLKIRSDMDVTFRDSSLKGPLWDEVSRKLGELGYHRSAKKCKEKFENVYKYHKRTKEGRTSKPDGKTYRFFEQLEALETTTHPPPPPHHPAPLLLPPSMAAATSTVAPMPSNIISLPPQVIISTSSSTVPLTVNPINVSVSQNHVTMPPTTTTTNPPNLPHLPPVTQAGNLNPSFLHPGSFGSDSTSSSSTSTDEEPPEMRRKRKRKWKDFFGRLMKEVIDKQEEMQMRFLETLEKRERDRMIREEAWRAQEMAKMNREHDLLVQERSLSAAKDAAVISFLQKITEQQNTQNPIVPAVQIPIQVQENPLPTPPPPPAPIVPSVVQQQQQHQQQPQQKQQQQPAPAPPQAPITAAPVQLPIQAPVVAPSIVRMDNGGGGGDSTNILGPSPSRWPKAEVQALIRLRTTLDVKYQENGPKGPLWEEISSSMRKLGYNRNSKRCKEKWENINKYYKKVKESSKKRPEDSKTCPYFHQLDAIYREKAKTDSSFNPGFGIKPESQMAPIMARPEQQWPLPQDQQRVESGMDYHDHDHDHENIDQNHEDDDEDEDEDEEEDEGGGYEIVTNKTSSMTTIE